MSLLRFATIVAALAASTAASSTPSVFVRVEPGGTWWNGEMNARILGRAAGPVTAERLSEYLERELIYGPYRVCSLEAIQTDTFVGIDRATQTEINATLPHVAWRATGVTPDGRRVLGQSVVFEGCDDGDPRGAALLVTDAGSGEILRWEPFGERTVGSASVPTWVMFISPKEGDHDLFSFSGCTECGERTYVYYDVTRRRIYTEYNGH
jgi:hypothetical protein